MEEMMTLVFLATNIQERLLVSSYGFLITIFFGGGGATTAAFMVEAISILRVKLLYLKDGGNSFQRNVVV